MENCGCDDTDYSLEHTVEVKQLLGLRYNSADKTIEIGVKCGDKSIEMALKIEEVKEFQEGLSMVLEEAEADKSDETQPEIVEEAQPETEPSAE